MGPHLFFPSGGKSYSLLLSAPPALNIPELIKVRDLHIPLFSPHWSHKDVSYFFFVPVFFLLFPFPLSFFVPLPPARPAAEDDQSRDLPSPSRNCSHVLPPLSFPPCPSLPVASFLNSIPKKHQRPPFFFFYCARRRGKTVLPFPLLPLSTYLQKYNFLQVGPPTEIPKIFTFSPPLFLSYSSPILLFSSLRFEGPFHARDSLFRYSLPLSPTSYYRFKR